jgi:hypothetical protein
MERKSLTKQLRDILGQAKNPKNKIKAVGKIGAQDVEYMFNTDNNKKRNQLIADVGYALSLAESSHEDYKDKVEFTLLDDDFTMAF